MFPSSQLQQARDVDANPQALKPKPGTRGGLGGAGAPRRALGDITNATNKSQADVNKAGGVPQKAFGLASAAPLYHAPPTIIPSPARSMETEEETNAAVEDMMMSLDLATEVSEMEDYMNIEEERAETQYTTGDIHGMSIKPSAHVAAAGMDDIDQSDADNPLAVVEYVNDQYEFYREKECRPGYDPNYMSKQPYINTRMRTILIDWLVEVHYRLKGEPETLYLTVNILDRFLDRKQVPKNKLQLVGVTAYLIAAKYEEIYPPEVKELAYMADNAYDKKQILDMESRVLATLKFNITVCTAYCFLVRFLKAAHADNPLPVDKSRVFFLASFICERTLQELDSLHFLPSMIAAACVYLARQNLNLRPWSPTLVHYTHYTEETLLPCLRVISPWITSRSSQQAVKTKYSSSKYMKVSTMELMGVM